jgi:hypothetical protein
MVVSHTVLLYMCIYICSYDMSGCICYQLLTRLTGRLNDAVLRLHICVYIYVHRYIHRYIRYRKKQEYIYTTIRNMNIMYIYICMLYVWHYIAMQSHINRF